MSITLSVGVEQRGIAQQFIESEAIGPCHDAHILEGDGRFGLILDLLEFFFGYTILLQTAAYATYPYFFKNVPYDPVKDFAPITLAVSSPDIVVVHPAVAVKSVADLIALAKAKPGELNYVSSATGGSTHVAAELFKSMAGVNMVHVPYRGAAPAIVALVANEIQLLFDNSMSAIGHLRGGRVKALGIAARARLPAIADVPTLDESGSPGFEASIAHAVMVVNAVPKPTVAVLNRAVNAAVNDAEYKAAVTEFGVTLIGGTPEHLMKFLASERAKFADIIRKRNVKVN